VSNPAKGQDNGRRWLNVEFILQEGSARIDFSTDRLVGGGHATHGIGDAAVDELEAIINRSAKPAFGESISNEGWIEEIASIIAGERSPRSVRTAQARRQAYDEKACIIRPKGGDGRVMPFWKCVGLIVPKGSETRTDGAGGGGGQACG